MPKKPKSFEKSEIEKDPRGGARENAGREPFYPTDADRQTVEKLAGFGVPFEQIASLIQGGISADTLKKYFAEEMLKGKAKANSQVGQTLFQKAVDGDTAAAIWWSKSQMRWKEVQHHELTGKDGRPLIPEAPPADLPDDPKELGAMYSQIVGGG